MIKIKSILMLISVLFISNVINSQIKSNNNNIWAAKEFSKELSLFKSKEFLFNQVLDSTDLVVPFEVIPLAASNSGELTTLLYKCELQQKEGLILGFYGDFWNETGVLYQGYSFKNLDKEKAIEFLNKIEISIEDNKKFLNENGDNNNIFFSYDDMDILVWTNGLSYSIRIFWQGFDSTWEKTAFERSKRRFEKKIK
jgi:hypothetical protein